MSGAEDDTIASSSLPASATLSGVVAPLPELIAGRYRIVRWLGAGGMGRVYAATDTELGENVALKVLRDGLTDEAIERFRREVRLTRRIQHRNVARMFDIGEHGGAKFLTMELVEGVPLTQLASTPLSWRRLALVAAQLCEGLAAAHAAGVVHRDLKPDNVLIERDTERTVITDFGIARSLDDAHVTQIGAVVGTPRYMSPEQLAGGEVDARSDLFSLGVMLYELACGARPWSGDNAITIAVAQVTQPMRPLRADHLPPEFLHLVERCLAIEPAERPTSAREVAEALAAGTGPAGATATTSRAMRVPVTPPTGTPTSSHAAMTPPAALHSSLAVLPVACATGDEYLADGLLDDLIDSLSTGSIRVRPAGLVRSLHAPDPREIGRQLEVDHVATVALRRTAAGLRVSARLISVRDGFQVWANRVDCTEAEILAVSDQLARGIATALSTRAQGGARPTDPRAVELYLRARAELRRFWGAHAANAADLLDRAVEVAPDCDPIVAARGLAAVQAWVMTADPVHAPRARTALERALLTGHGEAFLASAIYKMNCNNPEGAASDLKTALARAPMSAPAHEITGRLLVEVEGLAEARTRFETAIGLDPGRAQVISGDLARLEALQGNFASADRRVAALVADPDPSVVQFGAVFEARLAAWRGVPAEMLDSVSRFAPRMGDGGSIIHNFLREVARAPAEFDHLTWRRFLAKYEATARPLRQQLMGLQLLTEVALSFQRVEPALDTLAQAGHMGLIDAIWIDYCPLFRPIADLPRFRAIRDQVADRAARVLSAFRAP